MSSSERYLQLLQHVRLFKSAKQLISRIDRFCKVFLQCPPQNTVLLRVSDNTPCQFAFLRDLESRGRCNAIVVAYGPDRSHARVRRIDPVLEDIFALSSLRRTRHHFKFLRWRLRDVRLSCCLLRTRSESVLFSSPGGRSNLRGPLCSLSLEVCYLLLLFHQLQLCRICSSSSCLICVLSKELIFTARKYGWAWPVHL